jgi:hypothetical protein
MDREVIARILNLPEPSKKIPALYKLDEIDFLPYLIEMQTFWTFREYDKLERYIKRNIKTLYLSDKCFNWIQERGLDKIKRYINEFKLDNRTFKLANTSPKKVKYLFKKVSELIKVIEIYDTVMLTRGLKGGKYIDEMERLRDEIMWSINKGVFLRITDNFQFDINSESIIFRNCDTKYLQAFEYHIHGWLDKVDKRIKHAKEKPTYIIFYIFIAIFLLCIFYK